MLLKHLPPRDAPWILQWKSTFNAAFILASFLSVPTFWEIVLSTVSRPCMGKLLWCYLGDCLVNGELSLHGETLVVLSGDSSVSSTYRFVSLWE